MKYIFCVPQNIRAKYLVQLFLKQEQNISADPGCHLYYTACTLVLFSDFNVAKTFNDDILLQEYTPFKCFCLLCNGQSSFTFLPHVSSTVEVGKNKNKLSTMPSKNHENFKNSKTTVQFYWFLLKKSVFNQHQIKSKN